MLNKLADRLIHVQKQLRTDTRGNVLVLGAMSMPLLIGAAAIGVDTFSMSLAKRELQRYADSSALAGAQALAQEKAVRPSVDHDLALNRKRVVSNIVVETPPTAGANIGDPRAVRVVLTGPQPTPFFSFFAKSTPNIVARATGAVIFGGRFCMIALEDGSTTGITFTGNSTVDLGCGVGTNSKATAGITASGSARVIASPVAAMGGVPASSGYAPGTKLLPYSPKQVNPFASLPVPQVPANCQPRLDVNPNQSFTVQPNSTGVYCFTGGMDIKGTVTLAPGTYYLDGGSFTAGSQAVISGTGVTIILTSSNATSNPASVAGVSMHAGAQLNLSAPKTGTYGGVLFYQDPRAPLGNSVHINGNSSSSFQGGFYLPRAYMTFNGTTGMQTECLQLVARRLAFSGNSRVSNQCPTDGKAKAFDAVFVRLVS
jgi:hypothetical protein